MLHAILMVYEVCRTGYRKVTAGVQNRSKKTYYMHLFAWSSPTYFLNSSCADLTIAAGNIELIFL